MFRSSKPDLQGELFILKGDVIDVNMKHTNFVLVCRNPVHVEGELNTLLVLQLSPRYT